MIPRLTLFALPALLWFGGCSRTTPPADEVRCGEDGQLSRLGGTRLCVYQPAADAGALPACPENAPNRVVVPDRGVVVCADTEGIDRDDVVGFLDGAGTSSGSGGGVGLDTDVGPAAADGGIAIADGGATTAPDPAIDRACAAYCETEQCLVGQCGDAECGTGTRLRGCLAGCGAAADENAAIDPGCAGRYGVLLECMSRLDCVALEDTLLFYPDVVDCAEEVSSLVNAGSVVACPVTAPPTAFRPF
ncbi:MAG: hypothetical protein ACYTF3_06960 [Planctomycetota bacterium]|jgi:hypothetical protein